MMYIYARRSHTELISRHYVYPMTELRYSEYTSSELKVDCAVSLAYVK